MNENRGGPNPLSSADPHAASQTTSSTPPMATMEAANEAARRAVNGILNAAGSDDRRCEIWNLHEPEIFLPFRAYDRTRYRKGLSWDGTEVAVPMSALRATSQMPLVGALAHLGGPPGSDDAASSSSAYEASEEEAALEARASSDEGLRRLRIVGPRR